jgi:amino acid adenylation domain-containing protein
MTGDDRETSMSGSPRTAAVAGEQAQVDPVLSAFQARVRERGGSLAVHDGGKALDYAELDRRSEAAAQSLQAAGAAPGRIVALWAARSASLVVALLGIRKSGAALCILNPELPDSRTIDALAIVQPHVILRLSGAGPIPEKILDGYAARGGRVIDLEGETGSPGGRTAAQPWNGEDTDYILFTSGTTGTPKAVATPRKCLPHFLAWYGAEFPVGPGDRFTLLSGLGHDPLMRDVFVPLISGASLGIPPDGALTDPLKLGAWLRVWQPTVSHMTPSLGLLAARAVENKMFSPIESLQFVLLGGEPVTYGDVRRLRALAPRAAFVNCYGATETPQIAACFRIREDGDDRMRVPVGLGIADTRLWLRNVEGKAARSGERGEILVCAPYLSSGYLNDPALTARRFIASPAAAGEQYGRAYCTGDLGIRDDAGNVTCVGRADNQVKIRGFRVELEEIEAALQSIDGVRKAAVVVRETSGLDRQLVAWIEGRELSGSVIRESLRLLLPAHMIPARFVAVESLPLNASGKIDRATLSNSAVDSGNNTTGDPPATEAERVLASIWARLLDVSSVVREDSFFELGGDSLSAVELLIAVQNAFGVRLSPDDILRKPTLAQLGAEVDARASRGPAREREPDVRWFLWRREDPASRCTGFPAEAA